MKHNIFLVFTALVFFSACGPSVPQWKMESTIDLEGAAPIGIASLSEGFVIADGDNNSIIFTDQAGKILRKEEDYERPMHLSVDDNGNILIPEYGTDTILVHSGKEITGVLDLGDMELDAPAGVAAFGKERAIADFYNHRILYFDGSTWKSYGKQGHAEGEFEYPTDVQITEDGIYVADAYNNRIQVINKDGSFKAIFGTEEKMNAATGIYVEGDEVMITDFERSRILSFNKEGKLLQIIEEGVKKPTDLLIRDGKLFVTNYDGKSLSVFTR